MNNNYSFCKFKIPDNGGRVIWEITNECNYGCKYCIFSSTGRKPLGELSFEKICLILEQLKNSGFTYIKYTGGEPFLREDMLDILKYTKELGFDCDISTNASKITDSLAYQLSTLNLNYIHVSIDGHDESTHEAVRGKKSYLPTIQGLSLLKKYNNKVRIGTVLHLYNQDYIKEMIDFFVSYDVEQVAFSVMEPVGRIKDKSHLLITKTLKTIQKELDYYIEQYNSSSIYSDLNVQTQTQIYHNLSTLSTIKFVDKKNFLQASIVTNNTACPGGEKFLFINSVGIVSPCTWVSEHVPQYHQLSLNLYSLKEILSSSLFVQFKETKEMFSHYHRLCPMENVEEFNQIDNIIQHINFKENNSLGTHNYIGKKVEKFTNRGALYSFSTENLEYLHKIDYQLTNRAFTITGSGDQAIILSMKGFHTVDSLDINIYANYYAQLKIAALKILSFTEFKNFFLNNEHSFDYSVYLSFKNTLPKEVQIFYDYFYKKYAYNGYNIRNSSLFNQQHDDNAEKINNCLYLHSEEIYLLAQKSVKNTQFFYITQSLINFCQQLNRTELHNKEIEEPMLYNLILLSNIADYSHKMFEEKNHLLDFKHYIVEKLFHSSLAQSGMMMFGYVFDGLNIFHSDKRNSFNNKEIRKQLYLPMVQKEDNYYEYSISSAIKNAGYDYACFIEK